MFRNYLTIAVRHLMRHWVYTLVNIVGLAIGMTCVLLIALFIQDELSYDTFHQNGDRIYRVLRETHQENGERLMSAGTSGALGVTLARDFPEVENAVRRMSWSDNLVRYGQNEYYQRFCLASPSLLEIFTFPLVDGDLKTALHKPDAVILTERMAKKFFGQEDPMGKTLIVEDRYFGGEYTVTGILKDVPHNSSLQFDFVAAEPKTRVAQRFFSEEYWNAAGTYCPLVTHVLLAPNASVQDLEQKLPEFAMRYLGEDAGKRTTYHLQPLKDVHLHTTSEYGALHTFVDADLQNRGDIRYVYIFGTIAGFILMIGCANFVNLATARATGRVREVGLRKVVGAMRFQITGQFLGESSLLAIIALMLALVGVVSVLPTFNTFTGKMLSLSFDNGFIITVAFGVTLFVGLLAGVYPALYLSAFQPVSVLKGGQHLTKGIWIRKSLVVVQFVLSILLIISTVAIHRQLTYLSQKKLGMNTDQIVMLPLWRHPDTLNRFGLLTGHPLVETFRNELIKHPDILGGSAVHSFVFEAYRTSVRPEGMEEMQMNMVNADAHFLSTFDIQLVQGRNFEPDLHIDEDGWRDNEFAMPFLLNETAVKQLGWTDPIGKRFQWRGYQGSVVGVVQDFYDRSLKEQVMPTFIMPSWKLNWFAVKMRTENIPDVMHFIEGKWSEMVNVPFEYTFLNDLMDRSYRLEKRIEQLSSLFSLLAICIACMGLWGLAAFTAERRTQEMGVRKVLGASVSNIMMLFFGEFAYLVVLANIIAWPVAFYTVNNWLQGFAYRIDLGIGTFLLGGLSVLFIALLIVCYQAFKSATLNPVEALRQE